MFQFPIDGFSVTVSPFQVKVQFAGLMGVTTVLPHPQGHL
jgi:hypothetical protein